MADGAEQSDTSARTARINEASRHLRAGFGAHGGGERKWSANWASSSEGKHNVNDVGRRLSAAKEEARNAIIADIMEQAVLVSEDGHMRIMDLRALQAVSHDSMGFSSWLFSDLAGDLRQDPNAVMTLDQVRIAVMRYATDVVLYDRNNDGYVTREEVEGASRAGAVSARERNPRGGHEGSHTSIVRELDVHSRTCAEKNVCVSQLGDNALNSTIAVSQRLSIPRENGRGCERKWSSNWTSGGDAKRIFKDSRHYLSAAQEEARNAIIADIMDQASLVSESGHVRIMDLRALQAVSHESLGFSTWLFSDLAGDLQQDPSVVMALDQVRVAVTRYATDVVLYDRNKDGYVTRAEIDDARRAGAAHEDSRTSNARELEVHSIRNAVKGTSTSQKPSTPKNGIPGGERKWFETMSSSSHAQGNYDEVGRRLSPANEEARNAIIASIVDNAEFISEDGQVRIMALKALHAASHEHMGFFEWLLSESSGDLRQDPSAVMSLDEVRIAVTRYATDVVLHEKSIEGYAMQTQAGKERRTQASQRKGHGVQGGQHCDDASPLPSDWRGAESKASSVVKNAAKGSIGNAASRKAAAAPKLPARANQASPGGTRTLGASSTSRKAETEKRGGEELRERPNTAQQNKQNAIIARLMDDADLVASNGHVRIMDLRSLHAVSGESMGFSTWLFSDLAGDLKVEPDAVMTLEEVRIALARYAANVVIYDADGDGYITKAEVEAVDRKQNQTAQTLRPPTNPSGKARVAASKPRAAATPGRSQSPTSTPLSPPQSNVSQGKRLGPEVATSRVVTASRIVSPAQSHGRRPGHSPTPSRSVTPARPLTSTQPQGRSLGPEITISRSVTASRAPSPSLPPRQCFGQSSASSRSVTPSPPPSPTRPQGRRLGPETVVSRSVTASRIPSPPEPRRRRFVQSTSISPSETSSRTPSPNQPRGRVLGPQVVVSRSVTASRTPSPPQSTGRRSGKHYAAQSVPLSPTPASTPAESKRMAGLAVSRSERGLRAPHPPPTGQQLGRSSQEIDASRAMTSSRVVSPSPLHGRHVTHEHRSVDSAMLSPPVSPSQLQGRRLGPMNPAARSVTSSACQRNRDSSWTHRGAAQAESTGGWSSTQPTQPHDRLQSPGDLRLAREASPEQLVRMIRHLEQEKIELEEELIRAKCQKIIASQGVQKAFIDRQEDRTEEQRRCDSMQGRLSPATATRSPRSTLSTVQHMVQSARQQVHECASKGTPSLIGSRAELVAKQKAARQVMLMAREIMKVVSRNGRITITEIASALGPRHHKHGKFCDWLLANKAKNFTKFAVDGHLSYGSLEDAVAEFLGTSWTGMTELDKMRLESHVLEQAATRLQAIRRGSVARKAVRDDLSHKPAMPVAEDVAERTYLLKAMTYKRPPERVLRGADVLRGPRDGKCTAAGEDVRGMTKSLMSAARSSSPERRLVRGITKSPTSAARSSSPERRSASPSPRSVASEATSKRPVRSASPAAKAIAKSFLAPRIRSPPSTPVSAAPASWRSTSGRQPIPRSAPQHSTIAPTATPQRASWSPAKAILQGSSLQLEGRESRLAKAPSTSSLSAPCTARFLGQEQQTIARGRAASVGQAQLRKRRETSPGVRSADSSKAACSPRSVSQTLTSSRCSPRVLRFDDSAPSTPVSRSGAATPQQRQHVNQLALKIMEAADRIQVNGSLALVELHAFLGRGTTAGKEFGRFADWLSRNFRRFDVDGNGSISLTELQAALSAFYEEDGGDMGHSPSERLTNSMARRALLEDIKYMKGVIGQKFMDTRSGEPLAVYFQGFAREGSGVATLHDLQSASISLRDFCLVVRHLLKISAAEAPDDMLRRIYRAITESSSKEVLTAYDVLQFVDPGNHLKEYMKKADAWYEQYHQSTSDRTRTRLQQAASFDAVKKKLFSRLPVDEDAWLDLIEFRILVRRYLFVPDWDISERALKEAFFELTSARSTRSPVGRLAVSSFIEYIGLEASYARHLTLKSKERAFKAASSEVADLRDELEDIENMLSMARAAKRLRGEQIEQDVRQQVNRPTNRTFDRAKSPRASQADLWALRVSETANQMKEWRKEALYSAENRFVWSPSRLSPHSAEQICQ